MRVTMHNPLTRRSIEDAIERLLAMLDALDGDPDLEAGNDDEPSLGWTERGPGAFVMDHSRDDRERDLDVDEGDDFDDREIEHDAECVVWSSDPSVSQDSAEWRGAW